MRNREHRNDIIVGTAVFAAALGAFRPAFGDGPAPKLVVEERTVDLGRIQQGNKGTAVFVIENQGTADLMIESVRAGCGCTVPKDLSAEDKRVEPNESLKVEVVFDSTNRAGKQRKSIGVQSNDPIEPRLQLFLTAEVTTLFEIVVGDRTARRLTVGQLRPGARLLDPIELLPTEPGQTLTVTSLEIFDAVLTFESKPFTKDDRKGEIVTLFVDPDADLGPIVATLNISGRVGEHEGHATLSIHGDIVGMLGFRPATLKQLQPLLPGTGMVPVHVQSNDGDPFEIYSADAGKDLVTSIEETKDLAGGVSVKGYKVSVRIAESAPPGPFGTYLDQV